MENKSWLVAQKKERKFQHVPLKKTRNINGSFVFKDFVLASNFFVGKKVLEVGANMRSPVHSLREAKVNIGIDPLGSYYGSGLPTGASQVTAIGEHLPFPSHFFDVIICLNVLDHTQDAERVLKQINSCLNNEGTFLFAIEVFSISKFLRNNLLRRIDATHPYHFETTELLKMLSDAGFRVRLLNYRSKHFVHHIRFISRTIEDKRYLSALKCLIAIGVFQNNYVYFKCSKVTTKV